MQESKICICGAGTMGRGIALAVAGHGVPVILYDLNPAMISNASSEIAKELDRDVEKKRIGPDEKENILKLILFTHAVEDCVAPLVIEAVIEKADIKSSLFRELAGVNTEQMVFATNTSSLSVTEIAVQTGFPERVVGLHFFNPANRMKLVEIIKTKYVSDNLIKRMTEFALWLGKTPVLCRDEPGFIVNHVARPFYLEALRLAEQKYADPATIDKLMESAGFKMGPFHLMDLIGNDINYAVSCSVYEAMGKPPRLKPSSLQEASVKKGLLGRKSGSGFFEYSKQAAE
jgi:3-hydroxybutyryl-CoA dehydrogenase